MTAYRALCVLERDVLVLFERDTHVRAVARNQGWDHMGINTN
jgi:hypothetical protein